VHRISGFGEFRAGNNERRLAHKRVASCWKKKSFPTKTGILTFYSSNPIVFEQSMLINYSEHLKRDHVRKR